MRPKISVIVPVYNGEHYLGTCIESVLKSSYGALELLLINDGSSDKSPVICREYEAADSRVKVFHQSNKGVSAARNLGLKKASGDYISFVDCDDRIHTNAYECMMRNMTNAVDLLQFGFVREREDGRYVSRYKQKPGVWSGADNLLALYLFPRQPAGIWSKCYRTDKIKGRDGQLFVSFDESVRVWEDLLFNCRYLERCSGRVISMEEELYFYKLRENSVAREAFSEKHLSVVTTFETIFSICSGNDKALKRAHLAYCEILVKTLRKAYGDGGIRNVASIEVLFKELRENWESYIKSGLPSAKMKLCLLGMQLFPDMTSRLIDKVS